jgi:hypothetical protein
VDLQVPIVGNEVQLPEFVHEVADAGPGCADDLGQRLLADRDGNWLRSTVLTKVRQDEQCPRLSLLARIEELGDQIILDAAIAGQ